MSIDEIEILKLSGSRTFGVPGFRRPGRSAYRVFGVPGVRRAGFSGSRAFGVPGFRGAECGPRVLGISSPFPAWRAGHGTSLLYSAGSFPCEPSTACRIASSE